MTAVCTGGVSPGWKRSIPMKIFAFALFLLAPFIALRADDNLVLNGDFTEGAVHWKGDVKLPQTDSDALTTSETPTPATPGLVIQLKPKNWVKITQQFEPKTPNLALSVTYSFSPDLAFSDDSKNYTNVAHFLGYDFWQPFNIPKGNWTLIVTDIAKGTLYYDAIPFAAGTKGPQTFSDKLSGLIPHEDETICLAFPPGKGSVTLLHVSVTKGETEAKPAP